MSSIFSHTNCSLFFLIGMPGVGKTFWGRRISEAYNIPFFDLDVIIAQNEGSSIPSLFAARGEAMFREIEARYLTAIIDSSRTTAIIACGGGTPCFHGNMALMKKNGTVIYLKAEIPLLLAHLAASSDLRPLLKDKEDIGSFLEDLLRQRTLAYEQAHYILHAEDISLANFDQIFALCTNQQ